MKSLYIACLTLVIVSYIGLILRKKYRVRRKILEDYNVFLTELVEEIECLKSPLVEFVNRVKVGKCREFSLILDDYINAIQKNSDVAIKSKYLNDRESRIIQTCFNQIGRSNSRQEITALNNAKLEAESLLSTAKSDEKHKGELYGRLGFLIGLMLLIIMI